MFIAVKCIHAVEHRQFLPDDTVTLDGTVATDVSLLESAVRQNPGG